MLWKWMISVASKAMSSAASARVAIWRSAQKPPATTATGSSANRRASSHRYTTSCFRDVMCHLFDFWLLRVTPAWLHKERTAPTAEPPEALRNVLLALSGLPRQQP